MQQPEAYAYIVEQPAPKSLRFRYECEGRSAGSIPGINNTPENRTFPSIKVVGHRGSMIVVVSCVTKDEPYKPHPHNLVGRDCHKGVCTTKVRTEGDSDSVTVPFRNLGIQCVKRRDIAEALRLRETLKVNPFKTSLSHRNQPQSIDLNAVRLAFQVFLTDDAFNVQRVLPSLVSEVVYDKKAMSDLLIVRSSHCSGPARGGTTVILLCEKVTREDTEVVFFRSESDGALWSERVPPEFVHKQLALVFKTPPYRDPATQQHITVQFQLHRISDGAKSNVYSFEYIPDHQEIDYLKRKRKMKSMSYDLLMYDDSASNMPSIKAEPQDRTPPHQMNTGYGDPQWRGEGGAGAGASWYPDPEYYASHQPNVPGIPIQQHMQMRSPQALSPHPHTLSPNPQMMSPNPQMMSPNPQMMSPNPQMMSPNPQMVSPNPQMMYQSTLSPRLPLGGNISPSVSPSPHYTAQSPHYVTSPQHQQNMPLGNVQQQNLQMGVGTTLQQQPHAAHQAMPADMMGHMLTNPQQQMAPLDDMSLNSGDFANLANLSSMFDSLDRLSTRDLLPDPE